MKVKELIKKLKSFKDNDEVEIGRTHDEELVLVISRKVKWRNGRSIVIGIIKFEEVNKEWNMLNVIDVERE